MFLVVSWLGNYINKNGRIKTKLFKNGNTTDYSLKVNNIRAIYFDGQKYYVEYLTNNEQWYKQNFETVEATRYPV